MFCDYVGFDCDFMVIGVGSCVEIWDIVVWDEYYVRVEVGFVDVDGEVIVGFF